MGSRRKPSEIGLLLDAIDQAFGTRSWHGTTLRGALRGLSIEAALWRPQDARHNIWELVLHAAYWKYIVTRRLTDDPALSFPRAPSDWPELPPTPSEGSFRDDVRLLTTRHLALRESVEQLPVSKLRRKPRGSKWRYVDLIQGIAAHDLYHAGQIQLLKRLRPE